MEKTIMLQWTYADEGDAEEWQEQPLTRDGILTISSGKTVTFSEQITAYAKTGICVIS